MNTHQNDRSLFIVVIFVAFFGLTLVIKLIRNFRRRKRIRTSHLRTYWNALHDAQGCAESFRFFKDGLHIVHYYGIPLTLVGCENEKVFRGAAVEALERRIHFLDQLFQDNVRMAHPSTVDGFREQYSREVAALQKQQDDVLAYHHPG